MRKKGKVNFEAQLQLIFFFRPKRERKLPAHLKAGDFEYSYKGPNDTAEKKAALAAEIMAEKNAALAEQALSAKATPTGMLRYFDLKVLLTIPENYFM